MRALLVLAAIAVWVLAIAYWSELPSQIPMHFGLNGDPNRFADKSIVSWFWMPTMAAVFAVGLGFLLPRWVRAMAVTNSALLNIPDQKRFRALPTEARVRVVDATMAPMLVMAIVLQLLFAWIVYASAQVALSRWQGLPMWPTLTIVFVVLLCAASLVVVSNRTVANEVALHAAGADSAQR